MNNNNNSNEIEKFLKRFNNNDLNPSSKDFQLLKSNVQSTLNQSTMNSRPMPIEIHRKLINLIDKLKIQSFNESHKGIERILTNFENIFKSSDQFKVK